MKQLECEFGEDEFRFRRDAGVREVVLTVRLILEHRIKETLHNPLVFFLQKPITMLKGQII